jgi:hypothetical protein
MRALSLLVLAAWSLTAQTPNTVTTTATVTKAATAGNAIFQVQFLDTSLSANIDGALAVIGGAGASAENLSAVTVSISQGFLVTAHTFSVSVPAGSYAATRDKLIAAQRTLSNSNSQGLSWSVSYTPSPDDSARMLREALPGLVERTRSDAESLAGAMGKSVDQLVALSTPPVSASGLQVSVAITATYSVK